MLFSHSLTKNHKTYHNSAVLIAQFTKLYNHSHCKDEHEQGQIQGALYALSSLAAAIGPVTLRLIYRKTSGTAYPGAFYLVASAFFLVAAVCAMALPQDKTNSNQLEHSYRYDANKGEGKGKKGDDTKTTVV